MTLGVQVVLALCLTAPACAGATREGASKSPDLDRCIRVLVSSAPKGTETEPLAWERSTFARAGEKIQRSWRDGGSTTLDGSITVEFGIDPRGAVADTRVMRSSGQEELDFRAQRAVLAAAPFARPTSRWTICEKCVWTLRATLDRCSR